MFFKRHNPYEFLSANELKKRFLIKKGLKKQKEKFVMTKKSSKLEIYNLYFTEG